MPDRDALVEHCVELLSPLGRVSAQRMFGGHGLRIDGVFMALIAFDQLYLKVDAQTQAQFAAAGCRPFIYQGKGRAVTLSYWTVPPAALDAPEPMRPWARLALDAALRAAATKPRNPRPSRRVKA